jgi:hypothetical protein
MIFQKAFFLLIRLQQTTILPTTTSDIAKDYIDDKRGVLLIGLTPPHFCACPKPGPGFPSINVNLFCV